MRHAVDSWLVARLGSSVILSLALVLGLGPTTSPCAAADCNVEYRKFVLPLDLHQGVAFGRGAPRPYAFDIALAPSLAFGCVGRWNIGAVGAWTYSNPQWEPVLGAALSCRVASFGLSEVGVRAELRHAWVDFERPQTSAHLLFDPDGIVRLSVGLRRQWMEESSILEAGLGTDLSGLLVLLGGSRDGEPDLGVHGPGGGRQP